MGEGTPSTASPIPPPGSSPPTPAAPTPSRGPRQTAVWVVVVAVAISVLLSVLLLGPFGSSSGNSSGGSGATFSEARNVADRFAGSHGTWELVEGIGLALFNGTYYVFNGTGGNATCSGTILVGSELSNLSFPAFRGNLTTGAAPVWFFAYIQAGTGSELALIEVGGVVMLAFELPGSCTGGAANMFHALPSTVVDSSEAVAAAAAAGGYDFLRAHPEGVSLTMFLFGGFSAFNVTEGPTWSVEWSTCSSFIPSGTSGPSSGYQFTAVVNSTTGAVVSSSPTNSTCGPSPVSQGIGGALSFGSPSLFVGTGSGGTVASQGCTSGDYCFTVPIETATSNVTPADFSVSVTNFSSGATYLGTVGFAILTVGGSVLVSCTGSVEYSWTAGVGTSDSLLSAGMSLTVDMGTQDPSTGNWGLTLMGQGPFANSSLGFSL